MMRNNVRSTVTILLTFTLISLLFVTSQLFDVYSNATINSDYEIINYFEEERNETIIQSFWSGATVSIEYTFNGSLSLIIERVPIRGEVILEKFVNNTRFEKRRVHGEVSFVSEEQGEIRLQFIFRLPEINESDPLSSLRLMDKAVLNYSVIVDEDALSIMDMFLIAVLGSLFIVVINRFIFVIEEKGSKRKRIIKN